MANNYDHSAERQMTPEALQSDCRIICEQIVSAWDGELDVVVLLVPKLGSFRVASGNTFMSNDTYRAALHEAERQISMGKSIKNLGKTKLE
jgi:hypothetical protein